jgi:hypothetical protein
VRLSMNGKINIFNSLDGIEARSDFRDPRRLRVRPAANPILDERRVDTCRQELNKPGAGMARGQIAAHDATADSAANLLPRAARAALKQVQFSVRTVGRCG